MVRPRRIYELIEAKIIGSFEKIRDLDGFNITHPYKKDYYKVCRMMTDHVAYTKAVNCIRRNKRPMKDNSSLIKRISKKAVFWLAQILMYLLLFACSILFILCIIIVCLMLL